MLAVVRNPRSDLDIIVVYIQGTLLLGYAVAMLVIVASGIAKERGTFAVIDMQRVIVTIPASARSLSRHSYGLSLPNNH